MFFVMRHPPPHRIRTRVAFPVLLNRSLSARHAECEGHGQHGWFANDRLSGARPSFRVLPVSFAFASVPLHNEGMQVLALEPYHGGSHEAFLDGWSSRSRHEWTVLGLEAYKWKWRMRHAAITLADDVRTTPTYRRYRRAA